MLQIMRRFVKSKAGAITTEIILAIAIAGFAAYWYWTNIYQASIETKGNELKTKIETDAW